MDQFASDMVLTASNQYHEHEEGYLKDALSDDSTEIDAWWKNQFWTLILGLVCGVGANMLSKLWRLSRSPAMNSSITSSESINTSSLTNVSLDNKMVFVVRTDLNMGKGKAAAQCAHAAVACYKKALKKTPMFVKQWELFGQAKVTLKAPDFIKEEIKKDQGYSLQNLANEAQQLGIVACVIHDAGHTQVEKGSSTVLGIGPAPSKTIDIVTGNLKLY